MGVGSLAGSGRMASSFRFGRKGRGTEEKRSGSTATAPWLARAGDQLKLTSFFDRFHMPDTFVYLADWPSMAGWL